MFSSLAFCRSLVTDLKDGVRLARLVDIVTCAPEAATSKLRYVTCIHKKVPRVHLQKYQYRHTHTLSLSGCSKKVDVDNNQQPSPRRKWCEF
jgi:hypothetical protein